MREGWIHVFGWTAAFSAVVTALSVAVALLLGSSMPSLLELACVATSYGSTLLFVLQKRQCYLWGFVSTILYAALFWGASLPASAAVQIYLLGALVYGYWRWGPDGPLARRVGLIGGDVPEYLVWLAVYSSATAVVFAGAWLVSARLGSVIAGPDSVILALTVLAQLLLDNKRIETWVVWIAVNVTAMYVYSSAGLPLVTVQYAYFLGNAVWGLWAWRRSMEREAEIDRSFDDLTWNAEAESATYAELRVPDYHTERAERDGITRVEAKRRNFVDWYGTAPGAKGLGR